MLRIQKYTVARIHLARCKWKWVCADQLKIVWYLDIFLLILIVIYEILHIQWATEIITICFAIGILFQANPNYFLYNVIPLKYPAVSLHKQHTERINIPCLLPDKLLNSKCKFPINWFYDFQCYSINKKHQSVYKNTIIMLCPCICG